jgi:uncharacterized membrane protein YeaQ/YmgE (transglycosylase-associated protein family)
MKNNKNAKVAYLTIVLIFFIAFSVLGIFDLKKDKASGIAHIVGGLIGAVLILVLLKYVKKKS